jgi:hypothetical protein
MKTVLPFKAPEGDRRPSLGSEQAKHHAPGSSPEERALNKLRHLWQLDDGLGEIVEDLIDDLVADARRIGVPVAERRAESALILSDVERELIAIGRRQPHMASWLLEKARQSVELAASSYLCFDVDQLRAGRQRTFWCSFNGSWLNAKERAFDTTAAVQAFADEYLIDYLTMRRFEIDDVAVVEHNEHCCWIRRGQYRVRVHGLSIAMEREWCTASVIPSPDKGAAS